ncbi:MAG: adenosylcobinamide-phosphate synthase CbiB [Rhodobacter sp.]|nr:adenosylcobinamide-phosphate synthase CbiB [Rhodobacter sp.]
MTLAAALILDAVFGEPKWLWTRAPHPAILMGRAIGWTDQIFNRGNHRKAKGTAAFGTLALTALVLGAAIHHFPGAPIPETLIAAILLAQRSLADHVQAVASALRLSTNDGRRAVAHIVGRDTTQMDPPAISRAAIESAAENFSDGVVAPAFWFALAGLPGLLLYKLTNTADSMIGYRTPRHEAFGWAAARTDDALNWLPARLSALLIAAVCGRLAAWPAIRRDAALHRSPNAGWPEAAMARALGVALAGPRSYGGGLLDFAFVHPSGRRDAGADDIDAATGVLWRAWAGMFALVLIIAVAW